MAKVVDVPQKTKDLVDILVQNHLVERDQVDSALQLHKKTGTPFRQVIIDSGYLSSEDLAMATSIQLNVPLIDLTTHKISEDMLKLIPEKMARERKVVPLDVVGDALVLVMVDPDDTEGIELVSHHTKMKVMPAMAVPEQVQRTLDINYTSTDMIEEELKRVITTTFREELKYQVSKEQKAVRDSPIVRLIDLIVGEGIKRRSSDIHFQPQNEEIRIRFRIDGVLHDAMSLPIEAHQQLVSRIKVMAGMDITERRHSQDGQMDFTIADRSLDIRVATYNTLDGELVVLRLLDKTLPLFKLPDLGFLPETLEKYQRMMAAPYGMILVAGPTGSGKTTTLYASLNQMDRDEKHIITIEDPVEYRFSKIGASEINPKAGITFASCLKGVLRVDPDIVLVGEIRDEDTAQIAIQASLTGHLVLASVHANDVVSTLFRMTNLGVDRFLLASALVGVVSQRMVRCVCPHCHRPCEPKVEERIVYREEMGEELDRFNCGFGCNFCSDTGYLGRIGLFELFIMTDEIKRLVMEGVDSTGIRDKSLEEGMMTMRHEGMIKVKQGVTTPSEVLRTVYTVL